jgi:hypothetical protein
MAANVIGSFGLTPTKRLAITRVIATAPAAPITMPARLIFRPSLTTSVRMLARGAPNTSRIPISAVRCRTIVESTP